MADHPDAHLYGAPRPKRKPIATSTSHSFASSLNSLLSAASSKASATTAARSRPPKNGKDDIFSTHNKGAKKRAAADLADRDDFTGQKHKTDIGMIDHDTLHRSKRKLEEKARLYAAMKRGDYVAPKHGLNDEEPGGLVDFDRKWAEEQAAGKDANYDTSSDDGDDSEKERVEYTDEFGRTRRGTRAEVARATRQQRAAANAERELEELSARPAMPAGVIFGDTVQSAAFNPDDQAASAIANLAAKRDRSATPPEEVHYDASKEVRSKGVGFYQFSKDKEGRDREMRELEKEREETVKREQEREERKQKKLKELEERRRKIKEKRDEREVDGFLKSLESELGGG
ncbi:MAG: hypothetical protein LQ340_004190 [Diploschistes diacapsis]|nr:MAG: hypothetical protein LQ340_004190 [Diploschistes diacapsis]